MAQRTTKFDFSSEEQRAKYLQEIISFFLDERGEQIGLIAAEAVLDFFLQTVGDEIYKKGVRDSKKLLEEKMADVNLELDVLAAEG